MNLLLMAFGHIYIFLILKMERLQLYIKPKKQNLQNLLLNIMTILITLDLFLVVNILLIKDSMVKWLILFLVLELEDLKQNYQVTYQHLKLIYLNKQNKLLLKKLQIKYLLIKLNQKDLIWLKNMDFLVGLNSKVQEIMQSLDQGKIIQH